MKQPPKNISPLFQQTILPINLFAHAIFIMILLAYKFIGVINYKYCNITIIRLSGCGSMLFYKKETNAAKNRFYSFVFEVASYLKP